jgi:hypothetical protein
VFSEVKEAFKIRPVAEKGVAPSDLAQVKLALPNAVTAKLLALVAVAVSPSQSTTMVMSARSTIGLAIGDVVPSHSSAVLTVTVSSEQQHNSGGTQHPHTIAAAAADPDPPIGAPPIGVRPGMEQS